MSMHVFDTLAYTKRLRSAGVSDTQAEAFAEANQVAFDQAIQNRLATKDDIKDLKIWVLLTQAASIAILGTVMTLLTFFRPAGG